MSIPSSPRPAFRHTGVPVATTCGSASGTSRTTPRPRSADLRWVTLELEQVHYVIVSCVVKDEIRLLRRVHLRAGPQMLAPQAPPLIPPAGINPDPDHHGKL